MPLYANNPFHETRITQDSIEKLKIRIRSFTKEYCILADKYTQGVIEEDEFTLIDFDNLEILETLSFDFFILAIDCDELSSTIAARLRDKGKKYFAPGGPTAKYYHVLRDVRELLYDEHDNDKRDGITHFNDPDFCNIAQAIDITRTVQGSYVEVGVLNGASARFALRYMAKRAIERDCYFFDVFDGFNYDQAWSSSDAVWAGTHVSHGREAVEQRLLPYATAQRPVTVANCNIIDDELPDNITNIALANLDVDIYEGIAIGLRKLAERMVPGGILIAEDPGHTPHLVGARLALNDFLEQDTRFTPIYMESGQTLLLRK